MDEYFKIIQCLPSWLAGNLDALPRWQAGSVQEIRFRSGSTVLFTVGGQLIEAAQYSRALSAFAEKTLNREHIRDILLTLCGRSLHTYEEELCQGYFTLSGGHRVGVGASYLHTNGKYAPGDVTSLNIRIARARTVDLPAQVRNVLSGPFTGLALVGPPLSGKTTVLRSIAGYLGTLGRTCTVVDERDELFSRRGCCEGQGTVDVVGGMEKSAAVQIALRTLSPQVILLDELGDLREAAALQQAFFSGVDFIFTLHASNLEEAGHRAQFRLLRQSGMLRYACALSGRNSPGIITDVRCY